MSFAFGVPVRDRWRARSMTLVQWLTRPGMRLGDPVCELDVDGVRQTLSMPSRLMLPGDLADPLWHYVAEGGEVGPWGTLLEATSSYSSPGPRRFHASTRRPLQRRARYPRIFINYRRSDSEVWAGRIHQALAAAFGDDEVFLAEFSIVPGEDFA